MYCGIRGGISLMRLSRIAVCVEKGRAALNRDMLRLSGILQSVVPVYTGMYMLTIVYYDDKCKITSKRTVVCFSEATVWRMFSLACLVPFIDKIPVLEYNSYI